MAKKKTVRVKKGFFGKTASSVKKAVTSRTAKTIYTGVGQAAGMIGATVAGVLLAGKINNR